MRCARTDKGVHAAGNVISLKLILEDPEIVAKINSYLPEQIRVLDIVRTTGSFSSYQAVDSRIYEYLVPSHAFLPPHPKTFLAKTCREVAEKEGDLESYLARQQNADGWWDQVDKVTEEQIQDVDRAEVDHAMESENEEPEVKYARSRSQSQEPSKAPTDADTDMADGVALAEKDNSAEPATDSATAAAKAKTSSDDARQQLIKRIRAIHNEQKRTYRIPAARLAQVRAAFNAYVGTRNFHNFTEKVNFKDASAKRHIKAFDVLDPVIINDTEWLSCRVHGQSFMIHQIRKMVGMAMMVVRTGCPVDRIVESFGPRRLSVPKAPSLGLLLERPVFEHYNTTAAVTAGHPPIDFDKHRETIDQFRQKHIYTKIFDEEYQSSV